MITKFVLKDFNEKINTKNDYSLEQLQTILDISYNKHVDEESDDDDDQPKKRGRPVNKPKLDKNGEPKKKREPTAYNNFIKIKIQEIKSSNSDVKYNKLLPMVAEIWNKMTDDEKKQYK